MEQKTIDMGKEVISGLNKRKLQKFRVKIY